MTKRKRRGNDGSSPIRVEVCPKERAIKRLRPLYPRFADVVEELEGLIGLDPANPRSAEEEQEPLRLEVGRRVALLRQGGHLEEVKGEKDSRAFSAKIFKDLAGTFFLLMRQLRALCLEETDVPEEIRIGPALTMPVHKEIGPRMGFLLARAIVLLVKGLALADGLELISPPEGSIFDTEVETPGFTQASLDLWHFAVEVLRLLPRFDPEELLPIMILLTPDK
jgi:hypothetical protein